ncbi:hypothetical protein [Neorhodopirellula lusitana]|uniref:hypothetical protein n=1 Tax=Neorhodopirellula lusitana TaxID=445327 RepID=UPI00384C6E46
MSPPLSREERWIARITFQNRIFRVSGTAFQKLVWDVMRQKHGDEFVPVRPQGRLGDGGNDGYLPADGHYFQIYGPETPSEKVEIACKKLSDDFDKILEKWNQKSKIKKYSFVFNDKYEGVYLTIEEAISDLEEAKGVICRAFSAGNLEDEFMSLDSTGMEAVLDSPIVDGRHIRGLEFGAVNEVIQFVMEIPAGDIETRFGELPEVDEKVKLNGIASAWADLIRAGARQSGHIEAYFKKNSMFLRKTVRDHVVGAYNESQAVIPETTPADVRRVDLVFSDFRQRITPPGAKVSVLGAVDSLISYYFEACDIFDPFANGDSDVVA